MATKRALITSLSGLPDDELLTIMDVASVLKESYQTSYERIVTGKMGPFIRRDRTIRVEVSTVRAFIDSCRRGEPLETAR